MNHPIHTPHPAANPLYRTIQKAILDQKHTTGHKPSLVQVNRSDYQSLADAATTGHRFGLSIENVNVISFLDIEKGSFIVIP